MKSKFGIRTEVKNIVRTYVSTRLKNTELFEVSIIWQAQVLENWKFGLTTSLDDHRYYELTRSPQFNGWKLDVYTNDFFIKPEERLLDWLVKTLRKVRKQKDDKNGMAN